MPPKARGRPPRTRGGATSAASTAAASADESSLPHQQSEQSTTTDAAVEQPPLESTPMAIPPPSGRLEGLTTNPLGLRSSTANTRTAAAAATAAAIASGDATGTSTAAPPLLTPGERPKPKLKFAPKNTTRKTKEQRAELNRIYDPPPPDESLNAFGVTRGGQSGRGARGRGRGRGGGAGRGGEFKREDGAATASGPFALGSVISNGGRQKVSIERISRMPRMSRIGGSTSRVKREGGDDAGNVKNELYSSSDSEGGPKVDVEMIELISSDDGEDEDGEGGERKHSVRGFAPVRIERHEHIDKTAAQQTGDMKKKGEGSGVSVKKEKGKGKEVDLEIIEERKSRGGRRDSGTGPRVKIESESPKATRRSTRSPEQAKKKQSTSPEDKRRKAKARSTSRHRRNSGIVPQSQEDFEENDRFEVDRFSMLRELGPSLPEQAPVDADGDHPMNDEAAAPSLHDEKENKLYLFQFPPILPVLEPAAEVEDEDSEIKQEEPSSTAGPSQKPTVPETTSKIVATETKNKKESFTSLEQVQQAKLPVGTAGKLQVHRSGKVTIVFGGIEFEVHRGVDCEFLQDIVVLQKESGTLDERGKPKGRAWGMGQLKGKFVATPDISKLI
ncbi:hypothetical protein TWF694_007021 [Orbilia ellipsospora]|uniref:DNA-directed RNA polymerase III RPC4 n=1 Tax=Orbilia ellipsospora TaxID=2528407 RepID=A0AAV9XLW8_9PEZI